MFGIGRRHRDDAAERTASAAEDAPHPDDPRKPDSPDDLTARSWKYVLGKTVREFSQDQCTDLAAALTYYAVLAVAPALLAVVSILGLLGDGRSVAEDLLSSIEDIAPGTAAETLRPIVEQMAQAPAAGFTLVLGLLGALWSASGYVGAFGRAMNRVYEIDEGRPIWRLRPTMLLVTLVAVLLAALIAVALVLSGPVAEAVGDAIGLSSLTVGLWQILKWPLVIAAAVAVVAVLYYATPNVQQPRFRWISVGAGTALLVWAIASAGFGLYVANVGSYDATYGSLAGVIVFLLWLWITNLALLFGAELDAEVERGRELQAGMPAEEVIQLPPRDTRASDKRAAKEAEDVSRAKALRASRGRDRGRGAKDD